MEAIDKLIYEKLGWTWVLEYASIILIAAAALLLILLITFIIVAARHSKNKKKFKKMQAQINSLQSSPDGDNGEYRAAVRAEIEPIVRAEIEREYAQKPPVTDEKAKARIDELNAEVAEKDKRIAELGDALMQANSAHKSDNTELYRTINDLNQEKRTLQNDINILRAENSQLKAQQRQTETESAKRVAATRAATATYDEQPPVAKKPPVKKAAPVKQPEPPQPEYDEDDDEDEYYDDYGDETSAIKVTLKFDRLKANWVIYRSDTTRAFRRFPTKQEALVVAKDLAKRLHAQLVVHKKDGKFQKI